MGDKYKVVRLFPSPMPLAHGQIIGRQNWRNFDLLVNQGYLQPVPDEVPKSQIREISVSEPIEIAAEIEIVEEIGEPIVEGTKTIQADIVREEAPAEPAANKKPGKSPAKKKKN